MQQIRSAAYEYGYKLLISRLRLTFSYRYSAWESQVMWESEYLCYAAILWYALLICEVSLSLSQIIINVLRNFWTAVEQRNERTSV